MKIKQLLLHLWPFIIGTLILTFTWNKEIISSLAFILIILIYLKQGYYKNEIFVLLFGIIIGALIELYGAYFVGFQIFNSQYTKIPLWLPLAWGYAFVAMRRVGNIIVGK